ncbi:phosphatase PAP2 family protein [Brevundimonas naejangsanensis]|uniref:Phosphatase PAP2 family protein n=1 Tax=Brevundimonas naejangsanensis TaxID=588932 RepID=A0A494RDU2_9CAUL|nr:phosphatase PAP2 family protein [Brevundimonas naejangsanensis]AYG94321.1 phosphatase PAP2 family protein [Brevundimonas naejangsanensis]
MAPHPTAFLTRALRVARTEIAAVAALLVATLGVLVFIEAADEMQEPGGQAFDRAVLAAVRPYADDPGRPWGPWWLREAAADLTSLGGIAVLVLFALIALGFLLIMRKRLSALLLVVSLAGGVALSEGLKALFERERPPAAYQAVETLNASFPSGHALLATVFYLTLGVMLTRAFPRKRLKAYVLGCAVVIALLIGLTRIYLGAHWASDVFAGWSVGAAWSMVLWLVAYAAERRQRLHDAPLRDDP